jgi:uncharacterized protein YecT (DUF1311 family)
MLRALACPLLACLAGVAAAQQPNPCKGPTTAELRRCAAEALRAAEEEMKRYLDAARAVARPAAALGGAQEAWTRYRDEACRGAAGQFEGGSLQPVVMLDCRLRLTRERTRELWRAYLSEQGGLPDPGPYR